MKTSRFFFLLATMVPNISGSLNASDISLGTFSCAGSTYANAKVLKKDAQHVTILHDSGTTKLELFALPKATADKLKFDPAAINVAEIKSAKQKQAEEDASAAKHSAQRAEEVSEVNRKADMQMAEAIEKAEKMRQSGPAIGSTSSLNANQSARNILASANGGKKSLSKVRSGPRRSSSGGGGGRSGGA